MVKFKFVSVIAVLLVLGACASKLKDQMKDYRTAFQQGDYEKAQKVLADSVLKKDQKSLLLWHLENGTVALAQDHFDESISHFQQSLELIDRLFTTKLSSKAASLLINDASDEFYGANYERSYAHYFLARALYARYLKTGAKLDLQGARGTILAWDTYFTELQRASTYKTLYKTDLMLKIFGGQVHEISEIRNDDQIALQLYKDALNILNAQGGFYSIFNKKSLDYIKSLKEEKGADLKLFDKTASYEDLRDFVHFKILALTKEIRGSEFDQQVKALHPSEAVLKKVKGPKTNVVIVLEEGMIPQKVGKPFNFGIKGAMNFVGNDSAKKFIATSGVDAISLFAMNKLNLVPTQTAGPGNFLFAHNVTKMAVQEAAVEFELPMIENVPPLQRLELYILDEKGVVKEKMPLPIVSENGDLARVVLEEDVVGRYVKTGTRVAVRHVMAIMAFGIYQRLKSNNAGSDFLAKSAAIATYVGAAKGIAALEKADTRHWTTLPQALRMTEVSLPPGNYKAAIAYVAASTPSNLTPKAPMKILGDIIVKGSGRSLHTFRFLSPDLN